MLNYALLTPLLLLLPLLGFVILGLGGRKFPAKPAGAIATLLSGAGAAIALAIAKRYFFTDEHLNGSYQSILAVQADWLPFAYNNLAIDLGLLLDPISVLMLVVISVVSFMVHIFSLGYMKGENRFATYYAFLSLFTFSMLGLVLASNIFQMYIFWELVGVSSYLLIGFYYQKPHALRAAKKAFIVTRFADFGFLIGILLLGIEGVSFDFLTLIERLTDPESTASLAMTTTGFLGISSLTWALTLVFAGGAGKSALFPLHIWLPDAMEGPTPVSALIHAATMVVAGVFLVARLFPVFHFNHTALQWVAWSGAFSALFAAIIACTQTDIKRVLAYSTISQIGYMMFALGVSGYSAAEGLGFTASMFHLFTHAFFKSLLFLAAGVIIHAVHSNYTLQMGGLRKAMPITHAGFIIGCLAIAGIPPLSGFFSKEAILLAAWHHNKAIYAVGLLTAGITAFYMFRLYYLIFWHRPPAQAIPHADGSLSMKLPIIILSALTLVAGFVQFSSYVTADQRPFETRLHLAFSIVPIGVVLIGIGVAHALYYKASNKPLLLQQKISTLYKAASQKFYIDEAYEWVTRRILFGKIGRGAVHIDKNIIDGTVNGTGRSTLAAAERIKVMQSGKIQDYLLVFLGGLLLLTALVYWVVNG
jgi:NADH-quinone oxidoreductase subunit L